MIAPQVTIVDGYVDEPAHFGVPPYIATYPRYVYGAAVDAGVDPAAIRYHTIDALRDDRGRYSDVASADLLVYVGGMTVPGKYVGGTPATPDEVRELAWIAEGVSVMGGPIRFGVGAQNAGAQEMHRDMLDFDHVAMADIEAAVFDLLSGGLAGFTPRYREADEADRWARLGAPVVSAHPFPPDRLICEIETGRGCPYRCSFCTEPMYGAPRFRDPDAIVAEVRALATAGIRDFRLGRQADLLAYGGDGEAPNPAALERLYAGISDAVDDLRTLHLDNINPITIVRFPERARTALATIARYNTPGDTAAFGLESADPAVQEANELNVTAEECLTAIEIVNEVAGWRPDDSHPRLPKLLPGINLLHGLAGETDATYAANLRFLDRVLDAGLLVRRINIRQVMAFEGTPMADTGASIAVAHRDRFRRYKRRVREQVDRPMLRRVAPVGTRLDGVVMEYHEGGRTFGRQLGTYPLLVAIPDERPLGSVCDVVVTDHGYRSVTGVPYPVDPGTASQETLLAVPGIGAATAGALKTAAAGTDPAHLATDVADPGLYFGD
jgi:radical SAM superfamily enzyme with C-terminal helix-hairpin-helix motif